MAYCYYHQKLHKTLNRSKYSHNRLELAPMESPQDVKLAIAQVCNARGKARIDDSKAHLMMWGLQLLAQLPPENSGNDSSQIVQDAYVHSDGLLIAPEEPIE